MKAVEEAVRKTVECLRRGKCEEREAAVKSAVAESPVKARALAQALGFPWAYLAWPDLSASPSVSVAVPEGVLVIVSTWGHLLTPQLTPVRGSPVPRTLPDEGWPGPVRADKKEVWKDVLDRVLCPPGYAWLGCPGLSGYIRAVHPELLDLAEKVGAEPGEWIAELAPELLPSAPALASEAELKLLKEVGAGLALAADDDEEGELIAEEVLALLGVEDLQSAVRVRLRDLTPLGVQRAWEEAEVGLREEMLEWSSTRLALDVAQGVVLSTAVQGAVLWLAAEMGVAEVLQPHSEWARLLSLEGSELRRALEDAHPVPVSLEGADLEEALGAVLASAGARNWSYGRVQMALVEWLALAEDASRPRVRGLLLKQSGRVSTVYLPEDGAELPESLPEEVGLSPRGRVWREEVQPPPCPNTADVISAWGSAAEAQSLLQELYEAGLVTYPRTESRELTAEGASVLRELVRRLGFEPGQLSGRARIEGHHECIRPASPLLPEEAAAVLASRNAGRVPELVRMYKLVAALAAGRALGPAEAVLWEGAELEGVPLVKKGRKPAVAELSGGWAELRRRLDAPLPADSVRGGASAVRTCHECEDYTEAKLVVKMRRAGIGRPSTYASTIQTLYKRGYASRSGPFVKLTPKGRLALILAREVTRAFGIDAGRFDELSARAQRDPDSVLKPLADSPLLGWLAGLRLRLVAPLCSSVRPPGEPPAELREAAESAWEEAARSGLLRKLRQSWSLRAGARGLDRERVRVLLTAGASFILRGREG